ncbi:MAG: hypothetical protein Q8L36_00655 [bacterium]|nr:hypothetical protein [bacterium]
MEGKSNGWPFVFLIILSIWFWRDHHKLNEQVELLQDGVYEFEQKANSYSDALDQANSNIEDAQSYAWSSYDDMGYVLDNLETVEP